VVLYHKERGQRLHHLTREMLQNWVEAFCDNYSGEKMEGYFQGDGAAPNEIVIN
jgi:hypothetical protein